MSSKTRHPAPLSRESIDRIGSEVDACDLCPRLRKYCAGVARTKRRAYLDDEYWGRPIRGFGDPNARLVIVGLAPAAHGANRTGRVFTGDRSGEWLYRALHKAGFANRPESMRAGDGLELKDAYISCVVKCAPPDNKPLPLELERCSPFLGRELAALPNARVYLALGGIALQGLWPLVAPKTAAKTAGKTAAKKEGPTPTKPASRPKFGHGAELELPNDRGWLLMSYHPSQQNTFTGRLTEPMFDAVFARARELVSGTG